MLRSPRVLLRVRVDNARLMHLVTAVARASAQTVGRAPRHVQLPVMCWDYVRNCTAYKAERGDQYIRTPRAFVRQRIGDCKSQAVFIGALCKRAGHQVTIRYVIKPGDSHYGHVYAVVDGVPVDPLLPYGSECRYIWRHDEPL
jgi:hypothetical protein